MCLCMMLFIVCVYVYDSQAVSTSIGVRRSSAAFTSAASMKIGARRSTAASTGWYLYVCV